MKKITISTTVDPKLYNEAKRRGILLTSALRFGLLKMMDMEDGGDLKGVNTRINELSEDNKRMMMNISRLQGRLTEKEMKEDK